MPSPVTAQVVGRRQGPRPRGSRSGATAERRELAAADLGLEVGTASSAAAKICAAMAPSVYREVAYGAGRLWEISRAPHAIDATSSP